MWHAVNAVSICFFNDLINTFFKIWDSIEMFLKVKTKLTYPHQSRIIRLIQPSYHVIIFVVVYL